MIIRPYKSVLKPFFDIILSFIAIILLSPVFIVISTTLFFCNSGSPFFLQVRPGKSGRIFKVIKFKTMNDRKNENGVILPDEQRLTRFGRILRESSLDEIPQLFNILKGNMSIVGPRPLLLEYLPLYNDLQKRRHEVKPGITGLAQVHGRNAISWKNKFKYDVWYVDHISFWLDMQIVGMTIIKVFRREGTELSGPDIHGYFMGDA